MGKMKNESYTLSHFHVLLCPIGHERLLENFRVFILFDKCFMSIHIIIDGYNLIRQSYRLARLDEQDLQLGREALINILAEYKRLKRHRVTVVFDGARAPLFLMENGYSKGVEIKFSHNGESADTLIKKMVAKEREKALVVSSDREIVEYVVSHGAAAISSQDFEEKLDMAAYMAIKGDSSDGDYGWVPTTKKKGPSRRLSKKARYTNQKIKKL